MLTHETFKQISISVLLFIKILLTWLYQAFTIIPTEIENFRMPQQCIKKLPLLRWSRNSWYLCNILTRLSFQYKSVYSNSHRMYNIIIIPFHLYVMVIRMLVMAHIYTETSLCTHLKTPLYHVFRSLSYTHSFRTCGSGISVCYLCKHVTSIKSFLPLICYIHVHDFIKSILFDLILQPGPC